MRSPTPLALALGSLIVRSGIALRSVRNRAALNRIRRCVSTCKTTPDERVERVRMHSLRSCLLTYLGDRESAANLSQGVEVSRSGYRGPGTLSEGLGAAVPSVLEGALGRRPPFQACAVVSGESEFSDSVWGWKCATRPRPSDG